MNASQFISLLDEVVFVLLFAAVALGAVRRPLRANVDTALLFGAVVLLLAVSPVAEALGLADTPAQTIAAFLLLNAIPYLLVRLVDDFTDPPHWLPRAAALGAVALSVAAVIGLAGGTTPDWLLLISLLWFLVVGVYSGFAFLREGLNSTGLTRRRMQAVAVGSILFMSALVVALSGALAPGLGDGAILLARVLGLGAGLAYFLGFAPPAFLRRTWQEPELRAFLERSATLARLPDTPAAVASLEEGAAKAFGGARATIGLWDADGEVLRYVAADGRVTETRADQFVGGQAFTREEAIFSEDAARDDPANAEVYRATGATAVLAAPIMAGGARLGVLCIFAERPPLFADDDLQLVQLFADQSAVILENRALIEEAAGMRARDVATRLKDDFLSAAAHDLRTPLTILLGQAELLERRATREPNAPTDIERVQRIAHEARRLRTLVQDLLDASRVEKGQLVGNLEPTDLTVIAADVCARHASDLTAVELVADVPVLGEYDRIRIEQLLDNLVENAGKYSGAGTTVRVGVWQEGGEARMSVSDQGIGIAPADLPHIFDRFYRGRNVDDRRHAGMGLGLFICRGIVEQHGGRIWAESSPGGSTFHVALPTSTRAAESPRPIAPPSAAAPSEAALGGPEPVPNG